MHESFPSAHVGPKEMKISVMDGSSYFKGLLLLISKDHRITEAEIVLMKRIGKTLGFEKVFCENAIHEILENTYIIDEPPEFSTKELAEKFIKDGLKVAAADREMDTAEEEWLKSIAAKNGLGMKWFHEQKESTPRGAGTVLQLEVDHLTVAYS